MASMTDYMQKVLQESAEVVAEPEKSEEELSAAILESYLSMSAAFATIENAFECASICAFCESAEIDKPTEAAVIVESFWDSVKNVFETIIDWFKSVIQGLIGLFTSAKLQKLIAKLKTMDQKKVVKLDSNIGAMLFATKYIFVELENFKEVCIDKVPEQSEVDDFIEEIEKIVAIKKWDKAAAEKFKGTKLGTEVDIADFASGDDEIPIDIIVKALEEINRMNMPKRGTALLKSLKFDEKKYVEDDDKNEGKEKVNRELVNSIKKLSRLLAKGYDKITSGLVKVTEIAFHNEKVDEKSDDYKENLKEAKEAHKNKVDYNKDEDSSNRPKLESAVEEPKSEEETVQESAETETVAESAKVDSTDAYFD